MRSPQALGTLATILVLAVTLLYVAYDRTAPSAVDTTAKPGHSEVIADPSDARTSTPSSRAAVPSSSASILVLNDEQRPIADAELRLYRESEFGTLETSDTELARSTADGRLAHPSLRDSESRFVVMHPAYVPAVVAGGAEADVVLEMTRAPKLTVTVISDLGAPLPLVLLVMSPRMEGSLSALPARADGAPRHARPTWTRTTDAGGRATFDSATKGLYFVGAFHEHYAPLLFEPKFVRLDGDEAISLTMQDMFGVAFAVPVPGTINKMEWNWNQAGTDQSYGSVSRNAFCREQLTKRFPDAHVFVRRPSPGLLDQGETLDVALRVILADGTSWSGRRPLIPLRDLRNPVPLEQDPHTEFRHLRVEIRTPSGRLLETPLQFARTDIARTSPVVEVVPHGHAQFLDYGDYLVCPANAPAWLSESFKGLAFTVSATQPVSDVVQLTMRREFVPITILPKFATESLLSRLHMVIDDVEKEGMVIANWEPSRGPVTLLAPPGRLTIDSRSQCYEDVHLEVDVTADPPIEPILLHLTERSAPPLGK